MQEIVAITPVTMKRLLNYQRVVQNQANTANRRQWIEMTLETMRLAEETRQMVAHIDGAVAYAGDLFRLQNQMAPFNRLHGDYRLHNALVAVIKTLGIAVEWIVVDIPEVVGRQTPCPAIHDHGERPYLHLVQSGAVGDPRCR